MSIFLPSIFSLVCVNLFARSILFFRPSKFERMFLFRDGSDLKLTPGILTNCIIPFVAVCKSDDRYCTHYHRLQLPLEPAFACTTHKMQGTTATYGAVIEPSESKPFSRGIDYVAASRPTMLKNLFLLSPLTDRHFNAWPEERAEVRKEYARLALLLPST